MRAISWLILSLTLILSAGFTTSTFANPARTSCGGNLSNLTISGDVLVPAGERCALIGVTVRGDVSVHEAASLEIIASRIDGSVAGSHFEHVSFRDASVGGRVYLTSGASAEFERALVTGPVQLIELVDARVLQSRVQSNLVIRGSREAALLCGTTVEGNARFAEHQGGLLIGDDPFSPGFCGANEVRGNLWVHHNQSDTIVANTTVGKNLACAANDPAPVLYGNQVSGKARGQCGAGEPLDVAEPGDDE